MHMPSGIRTLFWKGLVCLPLNETRILLLQLFSTSQFCPPPGRQRQLKLRCKSCRSASFICSVNFFPRDVR